LWPWAALHDPESTIAKVNLLALFMSHNDRVHARQLGDQMLADKNLCEICMLKVASEAMADGDLARARTALDRIQNSGSPAETRGWNGFILATGRLRELEHDLAGAATAYHDALTMDPLDPMAHNAFALFLARQGKAAEARAAMDETLPLYPSDVREQRRQEFEQTLTTALLSVQPPAPQ
jgi:Tfp pilus assembly protein PilF